MNMRDAEAGSEPTSFESDYQLLPLGKDFEARAHRAEAIASAALAELLDLDRGALPPTVVRMRNVQRVAQAALDPYRDPHMVEARQAQEDAESDLGSQG